MREDFKKNGYGKERHLPGVMSALVLDEGYIYFASSITGDRRLFLTTQSVRMIQLSYFPNSGICFEHVKTAYKMCTTIMAVVESSMR